MLTTPGSASTTSAEEQLLRAELFFSHRVRVADRTGCVLTRAKAGDSVAFAEFYDANIDHLMRWFQLRTASADVAADLCSETFASALTSLSRFDPDLGTPSAWLFGIAKNELRRWHRRRAVAESARSRLQIHLEAPNADELDLVELRADLERLIGPLNDALQQLSDGTRTALRMRVIEERPYAEIAVALGTKETAVRVRVSRALSTLLASLGQEATP